MELPIQMPVVWQLKKCKEKPDLTVAYKGECQKQGQLQSCNIIVALKA